MVASDTRERADVLGYPFSVPQRRYFMGVGNVLLAKLANVYGAGSDLLIIDITVLIFTGFPLYVFPFEFDQLFAMRTRQIVLPLVAAEIPLPNAAF